MCIRNIGKYMTQGNIPVCGNIVDSKKSRG